MKRVHPITGVPLVPRYIMPLAAIVPIVIVIGYSVGAEFREMRSII